MQRNALPRALFCLLSASIAGGCEPAADADAGREDGGRPTDAPPALDGAGLDGGPDVDGGSPLDGSIAVPDAPADGGTPHPTACTRFRSGHFLRRVDSTDRREDGLAQIRSAITNYDLTNFAGFVYMIDWSMLEPSPGVYDFSRLDAALELMRPEGLSLFIKVLDRNFWSSCAGAHTVPDDIAVDDGPTGRSCFAQVWDPAVMDRLIALYIAIAEHFADEPAVIGFTTEETALDSVMVRADRTLVSEGIYPQRLRMLQEVIAAAPDFIVISAYNWPLDNDISHFDDIVTGSYVPAPGGGNYNGGGIGWPDSYLTEASYPPDFRPGCYQSGPRGCVWYQMARDHRYDVMLAPSIENGFQAATREEAELLYDMLDGDIGVHAIVWDAYSPINPDYFRTVITPTVNGRGGVLRNSACPYAR